MIHSYLRIYYERSTGKAVLDHGPGSQRKEVNKVIMEGKFTTEHGDGPPKFWIVAKNCVVQILDNVAYVSEGS